MISSLEYFLVSPMISSLGYYQGLQMISSMDCYLNPGQKKTGKMVSKSINFCSNFIFYIYIRICNGNLSKIPIVE